MKTVAGELVYSLLQIHN